MKDKLLKESIKGKEFYILKAVDMKERFLIMLHKELGYYIIIMVRYIKVIFKMIREMGMEC